MLCLLLLQGPRAAAKGARKAAVAAAAAASAATATDLDDEDVDDEVLAAVTEELPKMHVALCIQLKARCFSRMFWFGDVLGAYVHKLASGLRPRRMTCLSLARSRMRGRARASRHRRSAVPLCGRSPPPSPPQWSGVQRRSNPGGD